RGARRRVVRGRARRDGGHPRPERLREVDADQAALDAAPERRRRRAHLRSRRLHRNESRPPADQPRVRGGLLLQEDVRDREPELRSSLLRDGARRDQEADSRDPRAGRIPARPDRGAARGYVSRDAAEGGACTRPADGTNRAAPRRADDRPRPALEGRGADIHPRDPRTPRRNRPALHARPRRGRAARRAGRNPRSRPADRARSRRRAEAEVRGRNAGRGVLRRDRQGVRGRATGGGRIVQGAAAVLRHELIGLAGVFERNVYLVKRYIWWDIAFFVWTVANTLTIVFIGEGVQATGGDVDVERLTTTLLVGAVVWAYLG